jgi:hypothetical protein
LAFIYYFHMGRDAGWRWRVGVPALWLAATLLSKASGLVFGPLAMVVVEFEHLARRGVFSLPGSAHPGKEMGWPGWGAWLWHGWQQLRPLRRDALQICVLAMTLTFVYCGCDWRTQPSWVAWAHQLPGDTFGQCMVWLAENLCIFSNAGESFVRQIGHNIRGHGVFLLGDTAPRSFWYYYPVALTMKLSVPLLILPAFLAVLRPRVLTTWACLAGAALLIYSVNCRVQIGIRLMLPAICLAVVGLGAAVAQAWHECAPGWRRAFLLSVTSAGIAWTSLETARTWPHELCYTNALWGGTDTGYLCLSDSNYDWGQGLRELAAWREQRGLDNLDVWYFGTDPIITVLPIRPVPLHAAAIGLEAGLSRVQGHYLAASTTLLYGMFRDNPSATHVAAYLRTLQPVDRTQTFLIFDFTHGSAGAPIAKRNLDPDNRQTVQAESQR